MTGRIVARTQTETEAEFFRRCAHVMTRRAAEQLRIGRNPEQAAMLAAEYAARAQALDMPAVTQ